MKALSYCMFIAIFFAVIACNPNRIYESHNSDFEDQRWLKGGSLSFTVPVEDTVSEHKIYLALRHVYGFQFATMEVRLEITPPSGKTATKDYQLQVMGGDAVYLSDCSGDLCDLEVLIEDHVRFIESGEWNFKVTNLMPAEYIPNVLEFGLIVDKYPEAK